MHDKSPWWVCGVGAASSSALQRNRSSPNSEIAKSNKIHDSCTNNMQRLHRNSLGWKSTGKWNEIKKNNSKRNRSKIYECTWSVDGDIRFRKVNLIEIDTTTRHILKDVIQTVLCFEEWDVAVNLFEKKRKTFINLQPCRNPGIHSVHPGQLTLAKKLMQESRSSKCFGSFQRAFFPVSAESHPGHTHAFVGVTFSARKCYKVKVEAL